MLRLPKKIGVTPTWVNMIVTLLERGEERLVAAVETGLIPISFAIDIARTDSTEVQDVLMDGYAAGKIKGAENKRQEAYNRTPVARSAREKE